MNDHVPKVSTCSNCFKKFGDTKEVLQGADGTWVHTFNNGQHYAIKCNPWENWVAEPTEKT